MSLGETNMRPTAMLFRNLASMDVEESIRGNPIDGVVLLCGCDKTTPSLVMGAASCDLPALVVSGGPMLNGNFHGSEIGSGTAVWQMSEDVRAGKMKLADFMEAEACMSRSAGHCMTMGTASTMASMVEALGLGLPQNAAIPAVDSRRYVLAQEAGRRIVEMVHEDLKLSKILTREAFENAIRVNAAIGGSTNAVLHLLAMAGRVGVKLELRRFRPLGHDLPLLVDLMPSGRFLMEDFYYAGGIPAVVRELGDLIHRDALTVNGKTMGENTADAPCWNREVIREFGKPIRERAGIAVLRGNLAPLGAVIKPSAATPRLLQHRGRAVVFEEHRRLQGAHRPAGSGGGRKLRDGAEGLRTEGVSGDAGGGQHASCRRSCWQRGDHRRGAHLRRPHERHGVWDRGAARVARNRPRAVLWRWCGRAMRSSWTWRRAGWSCALRMRKWPPPRGVDSAASAGERRVPAALHRARAASRPGADLDFLLGCRGAAVPRESH